jgi:class 3 adenylate cyclase
MTVALVIDDLTEKKRLEAQRSMFKRMVSPAVIDYLDPEKMQLGGTQAMITTLFADIRGFTKFSERRSPEELVNILNRYLSDTVQVVLDQEGTIDKFMGDAIMAWFNHPIPQSDHALRAVRAAIHMRQAIHNLHNQLDPEFHLSFGVGIHFGEAVMGLIGTETRMDYTAIGDSVNTAKRIQENTAANQILISASAYEHVRDHIQVKDSDPIYAKGKEKPVQVFEVMDLI